MVTDCKSHLFITYFQFYKMTSRYNIAIVCLLIVFVSGCMNKPEQIDNQGGSEESQVIPPADTLEAQVSQVDSIIETPPLPQADEAKKDFLLEQKKIERELTLALLKERRARIEESRRIKAESQKSAELTPNAKLGADLPKEVPMPEPPPVSYSKNLDLKLFDRNLHWRSVGPGDYDVVVTRAIDNVPVYTGAVSDTTLPYSNLELDESIRYSVKITHPGRKVSEKKAFSLVAKGAMLNPTCK